MNVVPLKKTANLDALDLIDMVREKVVSGEIDAVAMCWVGQGAIGGDVSEGDNNIMMWGSIEHLARSFYRDSVDSSE